MKVKCCVAMVIATAVVIFIIGFRMGISHGTRDTIPIMINYERFHIASRTATIISDLHKIKEQSGISMNCELKKVVESQISDWTSCKENQYCLLKVSKGFYAETDAKIADFMALSCGD